ncbi:putative cytochrome C-type biogenesis protein [Jejuia pallidilutea]|uniref:Putative cytochrome C-type biogenesis protein n=1 Tax=Jejuia pallidilutea TaxID=504487 RepID=A0A090W8H2_9FLAO|nr:putative cytochrome C-type biogenesis protein [Jejuia pallidilutea]
MQEKLAKILFSTRLTAILFIVFAAAMLRVHLWMQDKTPRQRHTPEI